MAQKRISTQPKSPVAPSGDGPDLARKFMHENPAGSLPDPVEIPEGRTKPFVEDIPVATGGETPQTLFEAAEGEKPDEAVGTTETPEQSGTTAAAEPAGEVAAPPTPQAEAEKPAAPTAEQPKPAVAETPAPAAPAAPSYDPAEEIHLLPGSEPWMREQIVTRLQEAETWRAKADEASKFETLLGGDYADAEARWKPTLEKLAANPQRTAFLEQVLTVEDPAALDYLQRSLEFYNKEVPAEQRAAATPQARPSADEAKFRQYDTTLKAMEDQMMTYRITSEKQIISSKYPFLDRDAAARKALFDAAAQLFATDAQAGKPATQRRGLLDAEQQLRVFLEAKQSLDTAQQRPAPPRVEPQPGVGAQALLPGSGPGAVGTTRSAPAREYTGPPDGAKSKFLEDYPE